MATEPRARLGAKLARLAPGDIDVFFFTNGGAEANENAFKIARACTGRQKILARYRSYHGGTAAAHCRNRRSATLERSRRCRASSTCSIPITGSSAAGTRPRSRCAISRKSSSSKGPQTIAAFILESVTGTNGILVPPDGYMQGVRKLCDQYGILMIADEVMSRFRPHRANGLRSTTGAWCPT